MVKTRIRRYHGEVNQYIGVAQSEISELHIPEMPLLKVVVVIPTAVSADVPCPNAENV